RRLWTFHLRLVRPGQVDFVQDQTVRLVSHRHVLAAGENLVTAVLLIPLRDGRVLVHVLDDVAPADTRVVRAERNLTFLRAVRDDAHFSAAEVVVEEILEPHSSDKQEVPAMRSPLTLP